MRCFLELRMEPWNAVAPRDHGELAGQRARRSLARKTRLARHGRELRALRESALHLRWPATAATLTQSVFQGPSIAQSRAHRWDNRHLRKLMATKAHCGTKRTCQDKSCGSPLVPRGITEDLSGASGILGADPLTVEAAVVDQRVRIHERARASGRCIQRKRRCSR